MCLHRPGGRGRARGKRYLAIRIVHVGVPWQRQAPPGLLRDQMLGFARSLPGWFLAVVGVFLRQGRRLPIHFFVHAQHSCQGEKKRALHSCSR